MWPNKLYEAPQRKLQKTLRSGGWKRVWQNTTNTTKQAAKNAYPRNQLHELPHFSEWALKSFAINIRNDVQNPPLSREDRIHPVQPWYSAHFPRKRSAPAKNRPEVLWRDKSNVYDWYNSYLRANFEFQALADGAAVAGDTRSNLLVKLSTKPSTSTKSFLLKTCWTILTIMQEAWRKASFGILTPMLQMRQPLPEQTLEPKREDRCRMEEKFLKQSSPSTAFRSSKSCLTDLCLHYNFSLKLCCKMTMK